MVPHPLDGTEPLVFFHPLLAGSVAPASVPVADVLMLEEEPATWVELVRERVIAAPRIP